MDPSVQPAGRVGFAWDPTLNHDFGVTALEHSSPFGDATIHHVRSM
jgi:hypothetical protein